MHWRSAWRLAAFDSHWSAAQRVCAAQTRSAKADGGCSSYSSPSHTVSALHTRATVGVCGDVSHSLALQMTECWHTVSAVAVGGETFISVGSQVVGPMTSTEPEPFRLMTDVEPLISTLPVERARPARATRVSATTAVLGYLGTIFCDQCAASTHAPPYAPM